MGETYHVVPVDDLIEHEETLHCVCGPRLEFVPTDHGDGWIVIHNSLDGRENDE